MSSMTLLSRGELRGEGSTGKALAVSSRMGCPPLWLSGHAGGWGCFSRQWLTSSSEHLASGCQRRRKQLGAALAQQIIPFLWRPEPGRVENQWWRLEIYTTRRKHVLVCMCSTAHVWRSEDSFRESALFTMCSWTPNSGQRAWWPHLCPLSRLTGLQSLLWRVSGVE